MSSDTAAVVHGVAVVAASGLGRDAPSVKQGLLAVPIRRLLHAEACGCRELEHQSLRLLVTL